VQLDRRILNVPPPRPKHCPICGVAMLASRSHGSREADRFECLSCDLVINYSGGKRPGPPVREE
jgi:transposase-like protein